MQCSLKETTLIFDISEPSVILGWEREMSLEGIFDKATELILGAQIVGPGASDLIAEMTLAIEAGMTLEDVALTIHAHPTLAETIMDATEVGLGLPIHI